MSPEARIFIPRGKELAIKLAIEGHGGEVIEIDKEEKLNPRYQKKYRQLLEQFDFLKELLINTQHLVSDISVKDEKPPLPTESHFTDLLSDSGYDYFTYVRTFGDTTVHEYVTDDRKGHVDSKLVIYSQKEPKREIMGRNDLDYLLSNAPALSCFLTEVCSATFDPRTNEILYVDPGENQCRMELNRLLDQYPQILGNLKLCLGAFEAPGEISQDLKEQRKRSISLNRIHDTI